MDASVISQTSKLGADAALAASMTKHAIGNLTGANAQSPEKMKQAAQSFEAFFVGQMMEYMSAGIKADGVTGGGQAEDTWRSMLNQEYGKQIAQSGRLGIANSVMQAMIQLQEKRRKGGSTASSMGDSPDGEMASDADATSDNTQAAATVAGSLARRVSVTA